MKVLITGYPGVNSGVVYGYDGILSIVYGYEAVRNYNVSDVIVLGLVMS